MVMFVLEIGTINLFAKDAIEINNFIFDVDGHTSAHYKVNLSGKGTYTIRKNSKWSIFSILIICFR